MASFQRPHLFILYKYVELLVIYAPLSGYICQLQNSKEAAELLVNKSLVQSTLFVYLSSRFFDDDSRSVGNFICNASSSS